MAQQLLQASQIRAARQQMGGEAVAQRMGRGAAVKPKPLARLTHRPPDDIAAQWPAAHPTEQRLALGGRGAGGEDGDDGADG